MDKSNEEIVQQLLSSEEFMFDVLSQDTAQDVKILFHQRGVDLTDSDVEILGNTLLNLVKNGGELTEKELSEIAGGRTLDCRGFDEINVFSDARFCNYINTDVIKNGGDKLVIGKWIHTNERSI